MKEGDIQTMLSDSDEDSDNKEKRTQNSLNIAVSLNSADCLKGSLKQAEKKFNKSDTYNRDLFDSAKAKSDIKKDAFRNNSKVKDPYTGNELERFILDAKMKYGDDWQNHVAEADHIVPLKKVYDDNKGNPWLTESDIKDIGNRSENIEIASRKYNNAKRDRTNEEFVTDDKYLENKNIKISDKDKENAIIRGKKAETEIKKNAQKLSIKNAAKTGHDAGKTTAINTGGTTATISGLTNAIAVIKGEKDVKEAMLDTTKDTAKSVATGYLSGNALTIISHSLSSSYPKLISALSSSNVPGKVITAVKVTGDALKRYINGEITTQECIIEIGESGLNVATTSYSMAVGQALIPIPIVGAAIGALVGSTITSGCYRSLIDTLKVKELEHQERQRIIAECNEISNKYRNFRAEFEVYLEKYFKDYKDCFDEAISEINFAFEIGDTEGVIAGANQITKKLGGNVYYETVEEFKEFLFDDSIDIL